MHVAYLQCICKTRATECGIPRRRNLDQALLASHMHMYDTQVCVHLAMPLDLLQILLLVLEKLHA